MDPQIRWLRHYVLARVAERVSVEALLVGLAVGVVTAVGGARPGEVFVVAAVAVASTAVVRLGLAIATNPVNHRYLLRWTDPATDLGPVAGPAIDRVGTDGEDRLHERLEASGFNFLARLGPVRDHLDRGAGDDRDEQERGLDLYRAERGRLLVTRSADGESTVLSRLDDGRILVTAPGFVPPTGTLLVQRADDTRGGSIGVVVAHIERLLELRSRGVEAVSTGPDAVLTLLRAEWGAWQQIGPFVGPLVAIGPRPTVDLALQVDVPGHLLWRRALGPAPIGSGGPRSGGRRNGQAGPVVARGRVM